MLGLWNDICRYLHEIQSVWISVLESQIAGGRDLVSRGRHLQIAWCPAGATAHTRSTVEYPHPRSKRSVKWGLEGQYGQEKKLWINLAVFIHLPPSVFLSYTTEDLTPRKNKDVYIFITKRCGFFIHHGYTTHPPLIFWFKKSIHLETILYIKGLITPLNTANSQHYFG